MEKWFQEDALYGFYKQTIKKDKEILLYDTKYQKLEIFDNSFFGKVLTLDDIVQTTEKDEFFYHEMFVHVPLFSHPNPKQVLIVGGGDGGILRETLTHKTVDRSLMIEIDEEVSKQCAEHMPKLSNGAFDNKRADVRFIDGVKFVEETQDKFDVIIVDSTDPVGAATPLFGEKFYHNCKKILNKDGIICTQSGVPFYQAEEMQSVYKNLSNVFKYVTFFVVPVPTYIGGFMTLSFASDSINPNELSFEEIQQKFEQSGLNHFKYYNVDIHKSAFSLPQYIKNKLL